MKRLILSALFGGALGFTLAYNDITLNTLLFWVIIIPSTIIFNLIIFNIKQLE